MALIIRLSAASRTRYPAMNTPEVAPKVTRKWIAWAFTAFEDIVYVGLGLLLSASAIALLVGGIADFIQSLVAGNFPSTAIELLDRILLILLVVELLYTVQVSFRTHALLPEPFLLVGLIAAIRRVLVVTAEFSHLAGRTEATVKNFFVELVVLTVLILALAVSLVLVHKRNQPSGEES
jgi:uncharacterized membrane protein (DUF373 family)